MCCVRTVRLLGTKEDFEVMSLFQSGVFEQG